MLELLAITTGVELGRFVLDNVLDLGKPVLEGYVQDFFKACLDSSVARLQASTLKKPMAEAIGFFIQRFIKELEFNDVPETSLQHHYQGALKRFVRDKAVGSILGKAFETGCKKIDDAQLAQIWTDCYQGTGWQFPVEEFDWRGVAKEYVIAVKGIVKAHPELRSLLETDLLEEIAQNTAQLSPGFDVTKYRDSLQTSYGYLKLHTLDSTDRADPVKLWRMFIEQTVREALPPIRYDLPLDLKRQLQEAGQLEGDLSPEALDLYRREYFQQPSRKVLAAISDSPQAVILGDPGAGKSTLLQYLALEWVEGNAESLPLLIELREYVLAQSASFLDFLHHGSGADWQFDQQQLHQHLSDNPTLVMFDGLDEVFDRPTQSAIIDDIIRFAQQYPQARVLVTSRIIGYIPERFQHAGFRQFTLQPLDEAEIHEFIDRWYNLSMGHDPDKVRLKQRLKDAIANSKAIQTLADNPLLLTMMAILNRRQELPRDRADLYDQASRVLLYHWDVDHKRLNLPLDAIGRREKQEMLRLIAYEMQAGEEGLKGNLISAENLTRILTTYLSNEGFSEPREKANRLIQQLRERNFILCYRGADTYGFMHRTFLEYFCAVEIVYRFEKQRTLSFEQLRDEVFGQHWQDETWHEVLRLICGMIASKFSDYIVQFLKNIKDDFESFPDQAKITTKSCKNLLLAADCLSEISGIYLASSGTAEQVLDALKEQIRHPDRQISFMTMRAIVNRIYKYFPQVLPWLRNNASDYKNSELIRKAIMIEITQKRDQDIEILKTLKEFCKDSSSNSRQTGIWLISEIFPDEPSVHPLVEVALNDESSYVRWVAIEAIADKCSSHFEVFNILCDIAINDPFVRTEDRETNPRKTALKCLLENHSEKPETFNVLNDRAVNDPDEHLRQWAQEQLEQFKMQNAECKTNAKET